MGGITFLLPIGQKKFDPLVQCHLSRRTYLSNKRSNPTIIDYGDGFYFAQREVPISLSGTRLQHVTRPTLITNAASTCRVHEVLVRQLDSALNKSSQDKPDLWLVLT
jgi:hypothetical protein